MKYGTLAQAKMYNDKGKIEEWLQLFLRNDGNNIALADGLLKEERKYLGLMKIRMCCLKDIKEGTPEYLTMENDIEYFWWVVENMKNNIKEWDIPPLIIEYRDNKFFVNDGRHRLEMFRMLGVEEINVVLWTTGEEEKNRVLELLQINHE